VNFRGKIIFIGNQKSSIHLAQPVELHWLQLITLAVKALKLIHFFMCDSDTTVSSRPPCATPAMETDLADCPRILHKYVWYFHEKYASKTG
jgi:hypothetical protein